MPEATISSTIPNAKVGVYRLYGDHLLRFTRRDSHTEICHAAGPTSLTGLAAIPFSTGATMVDRSIVVEEDVSHGTIPFMWHSAVVAAEPGSCRRIGGAGLPSSS